MLFTVHGDRQLRRTPPWEVMELISSMSTSFIPNIRNLSTFTREVVEFQAGKTEAVPRGSMDVPKTPDGKPD